MSPKEWRFIGETSMGDLLVYINYVHLLVYVGDYMHNAWNEQKYERQ
jgi:hypothetical protein